MMTFMSAGTLQHPHQIVNILNIVITIFCHMIIFLLNGNLSAQAYHILADLIRLIICDIIISSKGMINYFVMIFSCQRECISVHVGQAGCQIGNACWELYCLEHGTNHLYVY